MTDYDALTFFALIFGLCLFCMAVAVIEDRRANAERMRRAHGLRALNLALKMRVNRSFVRSENSLK